MQDHPVYLVYPICCWLQTNNTPVGSGWHVSTLPGRLDLHSDHYIPPWVNRQSRHGRCSIASRQMLQPEHHHHLPNTRCHNIGSSHPRWSMRRQLVGELSVAVRHRCPVIPMVRTYRGKGGLHLAFLLAMGHCACYTTLHNARHRLRSGLWARRVESLGSGNNE